MSRYGARLAALATSTVVGLLLLEVAFRVLDRQPLTELALVNRQAPARPLSTGATPDASYLDRVRLAPGVDRAWYSEEPPPRPRIPLDAELKARSAKYPADPYTPFFVFNRAYVTRRVCGGSGSPNDLADLFWFEAPASTPYPTFRHLPHVSPPNWFVTNNYGWRGPDVTLARPASVIRIAFVGASTTVDSYSVPFSHPELVEHWLNRWAAARQAAYRFEVINAGRTGIDSRSIAAVVQQEVAPVDPDLVVFYEGANQFTPGGTIRTPLRRVFPRPSATFRERTRLERYSALARRVLSVWDRARGAGGREPMKPTAMLNWPTGVDESHPDPRDARLPMDLPQVVRNLDEMRAAVAPRGGELAVSSFIWLVHNGLVLDPVRHGNISRYLNDTLWPIPYAHIRRMADFQNRVFAAYAGATGAAYFDLDAEFPRDPDLFDDPIHLNYSGLRLQGWMFLQHIARLADARVSAGVWPRPPHQSGDEHPAFAQPERRLTSAAEIAAHCS